MLDYLVQRAGVEPAWLLVAVIGIGGIATVVIIYLTGKKRNAQ